MRNFLTPERFKQASKAGEQVDGLALRKEFIAEVKAEEDSSRVLTFTISTSSVDRQGDTVSVDGWDLDPFRRNPVVLWAHDYSSLPLGKSLSEWKEGDKLKSRAEWTPAGMLKFNDVTFEMYKRGFLNAVSVGFMPTKWAWTEEADRRFGIDFLEQQLLEFSAVPVPANAEALIEARTAGIDVECLRSWAATIMKAFGQQVPGALTTNIDSKAIASEVIEHLKTALAIEQAAPEQIGTTDLAVLSLRRRRLALQSL